MVGVRSIPLAAGALGANAIKRLWTVPAGEVVLVKSIYGVSYATATATARIYLSSLAGPMYQYQLLSVPSFQQYQWSLWLAMRPTDAIELHWAGNDALTYWVSGAVLPGSIPPAPATLPA